jgi:hypothetical protein
MSSQWKHKFLRRINERGEIESACGACFDVISRHLDEVDVIGDEATHHCQEMDLQETLEYLRMNLAVEENQTKRHSRRG